MIPILALFWVLPIGQGESLTGGSLNEKSVTGAELFLVSVVCGLAGVAWQLVSRRDLVDRLTFLAAATLIQTIMLFGPWNHEVTGQIGWGAALASLIAGLVYCEQFLRLRDTRRAVRRLQALSAPSDQSGG